MQKTVAGTGALYLESLESLMNVSADEPKTWRCPKSVLAGAY